MIMIIIASATCENGIQTYEFRRTSWSRYDYMVESVKIFLAIAISSVKMRRIRAAGSTPRDYKHKRFRNRH